MPVFLLKALFNEDKIMKAESQKTGIDTIIPVIFIANGDFFVPIIRSKVLAIFFVPPDFSRKVPIMDPKAIIIPMLDNVLPNPRLMVPRISWGSKPIKNPTNTAASSRIMNGCILNLAMATTIKINATKMIKSTFMLL